MKHVYKDIPHKLYEGSLTKSGRKTPEELWSFVENMVEKKLNKSVK